MACKDYSNYEITYTSAGDTIEWRDNTVIDEPAYWRYVDSTTLNDPQKDELKKLLEELANTPLLKIPFWIEQHKKELERLGVSVKEMKKK